jgi:type I restriction enzyme S subunit
MSEEATLGEFTGSGHSEEWTETPIGEIPADWNVERLEDVADINSDGFSEDDWPSETFEYISLSEASNGVILDSKTLSLDEAPSRAQRRVQQGDVLVGTVRPKQESHGFVTAKHDGKICSSGFGVLRTGANLNSLYLLQEILSHRFFSQMEAYVAGSGYPAVKISDLKKHRVPVLPLEEQRKIATVLYTVDQAIQKTEEIIERVEQIGRGFRQTLFIEGYHEHETEPYGTLGRVPVDWEKTRLYKIAEVARGKFTHRPRNDPEFYGGEYPFIQTGEVVESVGELIDYSQTLNEKGKSVSKEFTPGTIIITIAGNIGDTAVATFPVYFPDSLVGITPDEGINRDFLEHFLRHRQDFLNRLSTKTTQKNLNLNLLRPIEVIKPQLEEQKEIARQLTSFDNRVKKERMYKSQLQRLKQGLMQDLLSGAVRTHEAAIDIPEAVLAHG